MAEQLQLLDVGNIKPAKWNRSVGDVDELAESIKDIGLVEPIVVRPQNGSFELVAGERRWTAAVAAGLTEIPTIVRELDDRQALEMQLVENLHRKDLEPLEEAHGYGRLLELGLKQADVAQKVKRSPAHVSKRIALLELPEVAQNALSVGKITLDDAEKLRELKDMPKLTAEAIKQGSRGNMSHAIDSVLRARKEERAKQAATKKLRDAGVRVVDDSQHHRNNDRLGDGYGALGISVAKHKGEPCHAAILDWQNNPIYICTDPKRHNARGESELKRPKAETSASGARSTRTKTQTAKQKQAAEDGKLFVAEEPRRREFIAEILTKRGRFKVDDALDHVAWLFLAGTDTYSARRGAAIALGIVPKPKRPHGSIGADATKKIAAYVTASRLNLVRFALASGLFGVEDELTWADNDALFAHATFLKKHGYEFSDVEKRVIKSKCGAAL